MSEGAFLHDLLIFLAAAIVVAPLFERLRTSPVLGYLVAGAVIGPHGAGFIGQLETAQSIAELGVVFLLFTVGLELSVERLRVLRRYAFGLGTFQVILTAGAVGGIAHALGLGGRTALVLGGALALSSTAVVLQLLSERQELASRAGRVSLGVLLMQDLAVVPMLAALPVLAGDGTMAVGELGFGLLRGIAVLLAIILFGRYVARPLFRAIAVGRIPELFAAVTLFMLLGASLATASAGMSLALGGFLAGLLFAETEYRHQVAAEIQPYRGILLGLFFMTVGASVDLAAVWREIELVLAIAALLVLGKGAILAALGRLFGLPLGACVHTGLLLAQGGEFAFVLIGPAVALGVLAPDLGGLVTAVVALTMAVTPMLAAFGQRLNMRIARQQMHAIEPSETNQDEPANHIIIAGFGRVGRSIARLLAARGIDYLALDFEPRRVAAARAARLPVYFGDASRAEVLRSVGASRARALVVTLDDPAAAEHAVAMVRTHFPNLAIYVRARDDAHRRRLEQTGADSIVHETYELSLQLAARLLGDAGLGSGDIADLMDEYRADDYAALATEEGESPPKGPAD